MERTKGTNDGRLRWRKEGKGVFILPDRRKVNAGDTFFAYPYEIPLAFRDTIKPLDLPIATVDDPVEYVKPEYSLKKRGNSASWFDIVDGNGKVINEKALKKQDAEDYIKKLEE